VVLAELPARGEVDTARLEFAQLLLDDLRRIDQQRHDTRRRLTRLVAASKTSLTDLYGMGPIIAAIVLGYVGNVSRYIFRCRCDRTGITQPNPDAASKITIDEEMT
jgi:hypothetical protein